MLKELILSIDDELYVKLKKQFDEFGMDFDDGLRLVLESFADDSTTLIQYEKPKITEIRRKNDVNDRVTKSIARNLFLTNNCLIYENYTYASRGREGTSSSEIYWANPKFEFVKENWSIILNDKRANILYLLNIPKNSFMEKDFVSRSDKYLIDMKIKCNDCQFKDMMSKVSLKKYLVASIDYKDLQNLIFKRIQ